MDTANFSIEVYELKEKQYKLFSFAAEKGNVQSKLLKGFEVNTATIFKK